MLEVWLIRHGRTKVNRKGLLQGRETDAPLDDEGVRQARAAGAWARSEGLSFDRVISSPLTRAVQTAALAAGIPEAAVERDGLLLEMDYGPWEGYDLSAHDPRMDAFFADLAHAPAPEGMEPLDAVRGRAGRFLASLGPDDGRVLVSTHAILLKGALEDLDASARGAWWGRYVGNCWIFRSVATAAGEGPHGLGPAELAYDGDGRERPGV